MRGSDRALMVWLIRLWPSLLNAVLVVRPETVLGAIVLRPPQRHIQLMSKQQILGFKPPARLEQIDDENPKRLQDCVHRLSSWADSLSARESHWMEFSERTAYTDLFI
jgi:hypothetical protein